MKCTPRAESGLSPRSDTRPPQQQRGLFLADLVDQAGRSRRAGPAPPGPALSAREPLMRQSGDGCAVARCRREKETPPVKGGGSHPTGRECSSTGGEAECSRPGQIIRLQRLLSVLPPAGVKDRDPRHRGCRSSQLRYTVPQGTTRRNHLTVRLPRDFRAPVTPRPAMPPNPAP